MTRDEALLWMNDRIGRDAVVVVGEVTVVAACGVLTHAGQELAASPAGKAAGKVLGLSDHDYDGVYRIGGAGEDAEANVWLPWTAHYVADDRSLRLKRAGLIVTITVF